MTLAFFFITVSHSLTHTYSPRTRSETNQPRGRSIDLLGERTTGSPDLNSRHDPVTSWLASTGLETAVTRAGARSRVVDDDVMVVVTWCVVVTVTGVVWRRTGRPSDVWRCSVIYTRQWTTVSRQYVLTCNCHNWPPEHDLQPSHTLARTQSLTQNGSRLLGHYFTQPTTSDKCETT